MLKEFKIKRIKLFEYRKYYVTPTGLMFVQETFSTLTVLYF